MALRPIITIDEEKCDGCGICISSCDEGALKLVNGKAKLVSDQYCDGLGACLKECPRGALTVEMRDAVPYDEAAVLAAGGKAMTRGGSPTPALHAHHDHAGHHGHGGGCPGAASRQFQAIQGVPAVTQAGANRPSALTHWPVQLHLAHPGAPQYQGAHLLLCADCVPFSMAGFHEKLLAGKSLLVACPKLDDPEGYLEKLEHLFAHARPERVTVARMQVPCCGGLLQMALMARQRAGSDCPIEDLVVGLRGEDLARRTLPAEAAGTSPAALSP